MTITFTSWLGSKQSHLSKLLPLIPMSSCYVEPFGGGGSVLLNRPRSDVEVYNDLDHGLIDLFTVVRNPDTWPRFQREVLLTPYSRVMFERALNWENETDPVLRAVGFFIMLNQRMGGVRKTYAGNWARSKTINMAASYFGKVEGLVEVHQRLQGVQIESRDALDLIEEFDDPDTVFYLDPPYVLDSKRSSTREDYAVGNEADEFHLRMVEVVLAARGMVVMSGYESPLYDPLLEMGWGKDGWEVKDKVRKSQTSRREVVWRNPRAMAMGNMVPLTGIMEGLFAMPVSDPVPDPVSGPDQ